jgi:hypothetical protein
MPDYRVMFPSRFVRHQDLGGKEVTVIIKSVKQEDMGQGDLKPIVYFRNASKGLVLNKTNGDAIADAYGFDTDDWVGKPIELFTDWTRFKGQRTQCIRVRVPSGEDDPNWDEAEPQGEAPPLMDEEPPSTTFADDDAPF